MPATFAVYAISVSGPVPTLSREYRYSANLTLFCPYLVRGSRVNRTTGERIDLLVTNVNARIRTWAFPLSSEELIDPVRAATRDRMASPTDWLILTVDQMCIDAGTDSRVGVDRSTRALILLFG
jgi:hypothetical protein